MIHEKKIRKRRKGKRRREEKEGRGEEEERGGGVKVGGAHRDLDHTYPELSVARATLVFLTTERQTN